MSESENHIPYFSTIYNLYLSAPNASKPEILKALISYGHFPDLIKYLNQIWFLTSITPKIATQNMEFLINYFQKADEEKVDVDFGNLSELAQFLIRIFYQKAQPSNFNSYGDFLYKIFTIIKELDMKPIYEILIKCSIESILFPLTVFGVVNTEYNSKIIKLLFSLSSKLQNWIESFIYIISHPIQNFDRHSQKIIKKIEELLNDSTIITDSKLRILYASTKSLNNDQIKKLFENFYGPILKNISPKITAEGVSYIFKVAGAYYKVMIPEKNSKDSACIETVLNPLFDNSLPFFFNSPEVEKEAIEFASLLDSDTLQRFIFPIIEDSSFIRASLFFISHFPSEKTIHVLFKPISNHVYLSAQREAIIYFLCHFTCPPHHLSVAFAILKSTDLEENAAIDHIIDTNANLYCLSVIKYITFCIDDIEKVIHFSDIFLKKKTIPIVSAPKHLNHSVLTLSVHFFGYKKHVKSISALICYLKACKQNGEKSDRDKTFDYFTCYNDESHVWPNFIHDALTTDDEWREELCNLSLQRLGKQEFQQCIILAAISKDPMILHNSTLLLIKDIKMMQILFIASSTNWEKETLNEIKSIVNEYSKEQEESSKRGFFASLFSRSSTSENSYKPKIDLFTVVLNLFPAITQVLPYSNSLFDLLFTVFPADQKPQYMTLTCKAILSICQLIKEGEREIIHSIIDRLCNSNLSMCDYSVFENTLVKTLSVNQSMTEELALKIASLYISFVLKKQISDDSLFEETFLSDYYGDLTLNAFTKVLLSQLSKNEDNEHIFICFGRMLKLVSMKKITYFQRFDHILISNLYSNSNTIRKICFRSLNLIEQLNISQEDIDKIVKINSTDSNISNESLLYFRLNNSKHFVNSLAKKFAYKSSIILNELLLNHFANTSYNNQVSILIFFNETLSLYGNQYIDDNNNSLLSLFFKLIRKLENLNDSKVLNNSYTEVLISLAKLNSLNFITLILEQTSFLILNEYHLSVLYNIDSFIPLFIDTLINLSKTDKLPSVEVINRATQILLILAEQKEGPGFKYHDDFILLFIILLCLTSATLTKWTSSFKNQHFKSLTSLFVKFSSLPKEETIKFSESYLNSMNEGGIVNNSNKFQLYFNTLKIIQMLLERTDFEPSLLDKLNDTILNFLKYFLIAIKMKISNELFECYFKILLKEFEEKTFVTENLPTILFYLADSLNIERLKELRKNDKEKLQIIFNASLHFFDDYSKNHKVESSLQTVTKEETLISAKKRNTSLSFISLSNPSSVLFNSTIKLNSILFMRIVLVLDKKFVKSKLNEILKAMNIFILFDPSILCLAELSAVLIKIIKTHPDPNLFISYVNIIILKMSTSTISSKVESRQIACYFLSHLINVTQSGENNNNNADDDNADENVNDDGLELNDDIEFGPLFLKLASMYVEIDKSKKRYVELAKSVVDVAYSEPNKERFSLKELERIAAAVRPLTEKSDDQNLNEKEIILKFVDFLRTIATLCNVELLNHIINLITEFTSFL